MFSIEVGSDTVIELSNAGNAPHDITFELDDGRVVASPVIRGGETATLEFVAPTQPGQYVFYCSVGEHRARGMVGELTVELPDEPLEVVAADLSNPRGLHLVGDDLYVSEGGTAPEGTEFRPGNLDGRVVKVALTEPHTRTVLLDNIANAADPGGGVIGANHALPVMGEESSTAILISGGPGHPDPKAQLVTLAPTGETTVTLDLWNFETENNPDGGEIDSNPWRVVYGPSGEAYISDAGANSVVLHQTGDCSECDLLFAVFEPVGMDPDGNPISAVPTGLVWDGSDGSLYVSLLGSFAPGEAQVRKLKDLNGDQDALDEGENTLILDGLTTAVDLAMSPSARLWVIEFGGFAAEGRLVEVTKSGPGVVIDGLNAPSAIAFDAAGDALIAVGQPGSRFATDRVVRVPASRLVNNPTPTATVEVTATATPESAVFLPWTYTP
jgi:hypothetical protein